MNEEHERQLLDMWSELQETIAEDEARIIRYKKLQTRCEKLLAEVRQVGDPSGVSRKVQRFLDQVTGWE